MFSLPSEQRSILNILDLCRCASRCGIGDGPRCLLPCAELSLLKDLNQYWEDVGIDHILTREEVTSATHTSTSSDMTH